MTDRFRHDLTALDQRTRDRLARKPAHWIGGRWHAADRELPVLDPSSGEEVAQDRGRRRGGSRCRGVRRDRRPEIAGMGGDRSDRARTADHEPGPGDRAQRTGPGAVGNRGQRYAELVRLRADGHGLGRRLSLLCGLANQDQRGHPRGRGAARCRGFSRIHPAVAGRCHRRDRSLERAVPDGCVETCAGASRRLHGRVEARRGYQPVRADAGRIGRRGRDSAGRLQCGDGPRGRGRRSAGTASRRRQDQLHRIDRGRSPHRRDRGAQSQAPHAGARRQVPGAAVRRCLPR